MVRIKYRYLVVQILSPNLLKPGDTAHFQEPSPSLLTPKLHNPSTSDRLLALHAPTPDNSNVRTIIRTVRAQLLQLFGEYGSAVAGGDGLKMMYWSNATSTFVLRCRREMFRLLWTSLTFVRSLQLDDERGRGPGGAARKEEREVVLRVVRVSGTVKKALEEVVRRNRLMMGRIRGMEASLEGMENGIGNAAGMELQNVLGMGRGRVAAGLNEAEEEMVDVLDVDDVLDDVDKDSAMETDYGDSDNG